MRKIRAIVACVRDFLWSPHMCVCVSACASWAICLFAVSFHQYARAEEEHQRTQFIANNIAMNAGNGFGFKSTNAKNETKE